MANFTNPMTDTLKLVQTETVHRGWFTPAPAINAEEGFLLEHYRGSVHINSYSSNQLPPARRASDAKDGDTIFRLNLGPRTQLIEGNLRTWESYSRPYRFFIDLQIGDPSQLLTLYRQEADPISLAVRAIKEAIQQYADRTIYEEILPLNLVAKAQSAFDREPGRCKAGIRILEVHDPTLGADPNYQPVMRRQLLPLKGSLTTLDGYVRDYEVQIELEVIDLYNYKLHDLTGEKPLTLAQATIHGELQRYAHQCFYEALTELELHTYIEQKVFAAFPNQARAGLKITRANKFSLGTDKSYQPVPKIQMLTIANTLKTLEGYERAYQVQVELRVVNLQVYLRRSREGTVPLSLAQAVIEGEILQFAGSQTYEVLNDKTLLFKRVEHAFDKLTTGETGGLGIKLVHFFTLQAASDYVMARVLDITGVIKTADVRECAYTMTVEVKIGDAATYVQLTRERTDPLNLAKAAIEGAIEELARGKGHDEVLKLDLVQAAHDIFEQAPHAMIGGLMIVKAHKAQIDIDASVKSIAEIEHAREVESSELLAKSSLMKQAQGEDFNLRRTAETNNLELTIIQQKTAEAQVLFEMKKDQLLALSQGKIDFWQKAFQIATEDLESGASTADVLNNMQTLIENIQGNLPQIAREQAANGQTQLQGGQAEMPALKPGHPAEDEPQIVDAASELKPAKKPWSEAGLTLMEVPVPPTLRPFLDDREHAFQIREIEAGGPARKAGLRKGDFLTDIEDQEIHTLNDINEAFASITGKGEVQVFVVRNGSLELYMLHLAE